MRLQQLAATLAALWAGIMIGVGYVCAPVVFQMLPEQRKLAGSIAGQTFTVTAYITLFLGVAILLLVKKANKKAGFYTPNAPMILVLAALFLAIVGQFVIHPQVAQARDFGNPNLSFSTLHVISISIFMIESICVLALNWVLYTPVKKPQGIESRVKEVADNSEDAV